MRRFSASGEVLVPPPASVLWLQPLSHGGSRSLGDLGTSSLPWGGSRRGRQLPGGVPRAGLGFGS